jgi:hypothetical protein
MRTSRRGITVAMPPSEWRTRCPSRAGNMGHPPKSARRADRDWLFLLEELTGEGYAPCDRPAQQRRQDVTRARHTRCRCGKNMDYRGFELSGSDGELVAYRAFAQCPACWWWVEF